MYLTFFQKNFSNWTHRQVENSLHNPAQKVFEEAEIFSLTSENDKSS